VEELLTQREGRGHARRQKRTLGRPRSAPVLPVDDFISQKVFIKSFCKSQFPQKSVNVSFIITKLTDLCGN